MLSPITFRQLLVLFLAVISSFLTYSQNTKTGLDPSKDINQFVIEQWTSKEGLPINAVTHALHSSKGFLWLSTYNGLIKFDGYQFTTFNTSNFPPLKNNGIYQTFEDNIGKIWICTNGSGLIRLDENGYEVYSSDDGIPESITVGYADGDTIWVGSVNDGLYKIVNDKVEKVTYQNLSGVTILKVVKDHDGAIWFTTDGRGITKYFNGKYTSISLDSKKVSRVHGLYCAENGVNWIGTFEGLIKHTDNQIEFVDELKGLIVNDILEDDYGFIWMATDKGIARLNTANDVVEFLDKTRGLPGSEFTSITFDFENNLWFSSTRDGLVRLRGGTFQNFTRSNGLSSERVNALLETDKGLLVGTEDGGVHIINDDTIQVFELKPNQQKPRIRNLIIDSKNNLWLSSYLGLRRVNNSGERLFTINDGLPTNQIRGVVEDDSGILWIATRNSGVIKWKGLKDITIIDKNHGINSNFIMSINLDKKGRVVLCTNGGGVSIINGNGKIENYGSEEGILGNVIFSSYDDGDQLWITTNSGLHIIKNKKVFAPSAGGGLLSETIFDIQEDNNGDFWVTSSQGIILVSKIEILDLLEGNREKVKYRVFNENDGLIDRECLGAVLSYQTSDGKLWFPTIEGLAMIDPTLVKEEKNIINPYITDFFVDNQRQLLSEVMVIEPGKKRYAFHYTAPTFVNPENIFFKYRLENYDLEWNVVDGIDRKAQYTNLQHGSYVFKLQVSKDGENWSEQETSVSFYIEPHYYQTIPFIVLEILLAIVLVIIIYKWRLGAIEREKRNLEKTIKERTTKIELQKEEILYQRDTLEESLNSLKVAQETISQQNIRLKEYNEQLEDKVNERTKELKQAVDDLIKSNEELDRFVYRAAHDLRGPVSRLLGIYNLAKADKEYFNSEVFLDNIKTSSDEMDSLIRRLISMNEVKNKKVELKPVKLKEIITNIFDKINTNNLELLLESSEDQIITDEELFSILFSNLFSNSNRYRNLNVDHHYAKVDTTKINGSLEIRVEDNGIGIDAEVGEIIFDMFYKGVNHTDGFGLGLYEARIICQKLGGEIELVNADTPTFKITLPIDLHQA